MTAPATAIRTARQVTFVGPRQVEVVDAPLRELGPTDILTETLFSGISAGTEMNIYSAKAPQWRTRHDPETGLFVPSDEPDMQYPVAYGYATVGRVVEVGPEVTKVAVGDLVYAPAPHQSAAVLDQDWVVKLPELADPRVGVLNANLNTAYNGVLDAHPNLGDVVVVSGLGVIGLLLLQLLKRLGLRVFAIDSVPARRELAQRFGADETFSPGPDVAARVRALTGNRGADIVIEASGASPALNEAIRIVGYCGTVIALSWYGGTFESLSLSGEFHHNRPRIIATQVGGLNPSLGPLWNHARRQEVVSEFIETLDLSPLMTHEFDVEHAADAYAYVDSRPDDLVQCLIRYDGKGA
jgi:2-desacetyl-2-hydroxyethyl bacteriochlorophyllide A dehydrogenase